MEAKEIPNSTLADFAKQLFGQDTANQGLHFAEPVSAEEAVASAPAGPTEIASSDDVQRPIVAEQAADATREDASNNEATLPIAALKEAVPSAAQEASGPASRPAGEIADIILKELRSVDGVPERGFLVTVYGANPWNAMLTISPEAGRIKDAPVWRKRVQEIAIRLRGNFDIADEIP